MLVLGMLFFGVSRGMAEDYYEGKTIRLIVMTSPGGGYDTYARAIARHIGKHIPGQPKIIVMNMPGAGGIIATNYVYNVAKPDGLTILVTNSGIVLQQAVGMKGIKFDARKFRWIGTPGPAIPVCAIMGFTGLTTLQDVMNSEKPLYFGSAGTSTYQQPMILKLLVGANIKIAKGYSGTSGIRAAMQRKEVEGACWQWASMRLTAREMLDAKGDGRLIPFLMEGEAPDPKVKDLPQFSSVIKGEEKLAMFKAWMSQYKFNTPFTLPPDTPRERVNSLRAAFRDTMKDPEFQTLGKKMRLDLQHVPGQTVETFVNETLDISQEVKDKLRPLILR